MSSIVRRGDSGKSISLLIECARMEQIPDFAAAVITRELDVQRADAIH